LREHAHDLERDGANLFRARAFRTAASAVQMLSRPLTEVFAQEGRAGLERLPGIGKSLAYTLEAVIRTGAVRTLRPDGAATDPLGDVTTLPGVGAKLAEDLRDRLGIATLEQLHEAVERGRLAEVGVGPKRLAGIRAELQRRLGLLGPGRAPADEPVVADLLAADEQYRLRAAQEDLPRIAPRFFNPVRDRWLGVLHTQRNNWTMRVLFANTALAHRLGKTHDWVVVTFEQGTLTGQRTVVTQTHGEMAGLRVVRGREAECLAHYQALPAA
jgi:hypothetical protein